MEFVCRPFQGLRKVLGLLAIHLDVKLGLRRKYSSVNRVTNTGLANCIETPRMTLLNTPNPSSSLKPQDAMTLKPNNPAPGVPYYTPAQEPPAGTPLNPETAPTLFRPIKIRGVTLGNRIIVSPMCTYSAEDGHLTNWHLVHLGQFALHGAGLVFVEATAVQAIGRISPEDSGLWKDSQIAPLKRITDLVHSQGRLAAIQLGHAGRKASTRASWHMKPGDKFLSPPEEGGWPDEVVAPSSIPFIEGSFANPKELTLEEIKGVVKSFADAAIRAIQAGFGKFSASSDVVIHILTR